VHKGSTQNIKRSKLGFKRNRREPWSGAPDCPVCHRTVSDAPGPYDSELAAFGFQKRRSAIIHRTVRCAIGLSGAPSGVMANSATVGCNGRLQSYTKLGMKLYKIWKIGSERRLNQRQSCAQGSFGSVAEKGTDLRRKRLSSPR
jgi:hypothetical protein